MRYIPENSETIEQKETNHIIYTYKNYEYFSAIGYGGKRSKPDFHYRFRTEEEREAYIQKFLSDRKEIHIYKDEQKQAKKLQKQKELKDLKVGDIFHCGWGYEQTQCDFYQLIALKGSTATFRKIGANTVKGSEGFECDRRKADIDNFTGEEFKKRLNGAYFKVTDSQRASKVKDPQNESFYCSWYY